MTQTSVLRAWSVAAASLRDSATRSCAGAEPSAALARARSAAARFGLVAALLPMLITLGCLPAYYDDKRNQSSSAQPPEPFNGGPVALDAGRRLDATAADGRIVVPQCPSNLLDCDGLCFDPRSTAEHCGACGNVCLAPARCVAGTCEPTCTAGEQLCAGTCIDVQSDPAHCGSCSGSCRAEQTCRAGSCAAPTSDWQTLGGNMQRTGYNGREQGTPPRAPGWAVSLVAAPLQPVVVEGTRVFVSYATRFAESGPLFALDVATGNQLWVHDFGRVGDVGQPTVRDGRVYLELSAGADFSSQLAVLRADSGAVVWTRELESQLQRYWAPTVTAAAIYLDSGDGDALHALRRSTGAELFVNGELEAYDAWSAAADDRGVYTFVAGKLRRHDLQTGAVSRTMSVTWTGAEHSMMTAPVLAAEGTVYVIAPPSLYAFEPDSQTLLWSVTSMLAGMPALADDKLLALDGQRLSAFAAKTGALLWQCSEAVALRYPPVAAHGFAYVASESATYAVDLSTGKVAWQTPFGGWLSIAAGRLFVAAADGTLHSFVLTAAEPLAP